MKVPNEKDRLAADAKRLANWKRWGPYLSERQWATVREDYSPQGRVWEYFPHDHARSRAYRWGEDGLLGMTDRECRLCFALALWNRKDPILKERLFGLTGPEGNHGEDVKECYYYLDSTPTHSYFKALYKYPQAEFPYDRLVEENRRRGRRDPEFELSDTGIFDENRYFDVLAEYAKAGPDDILIRITVTNRGPESAPLDLLPTLWYRNTWIWGCKHEGCWVRPTLKATAEGALQGDHVNLGRHYFVAGPGLEGQPSQFLFTENETNTRRLYGVDNWTPYVKDAFHEFLIHGRSEAVNPKPTGTKAAALYRLQLPPQGQVSLRLRLSMQPLSPQASLGTEFDRVFAARVREADAFYAERLPQGLTAGQCQIARQAYAGLLWSKQFYHYIVRDWLEGDPQQPTPPASRWSGRNTDWFHLYNRDVLSMPDKWEYPWFAAWDLAFHMIPLAHIDPDFTKQQLVLFLREWYMHPNGQLPAYEFNFGDVNPPVHAWACWRVYKMAGARGRRDRLFLSRCFQKLIITFTWWVNRKDPEGKNLFAGGFLGLDNIGVFDRSQPLPTGGHLGQADGTAWMAFFCATMLSIALELARDNPATEDMASKFFEHFVAITDAINTHGGSGLWDETDGFYYDHLRVDGRTIPLKVRSLVGLIPLLAVEVLDEELIQRLPGFKKRMDWFLQHRPELNQLSSYYCCSLDDAARGRRLLAIPSRQRLERLLRYLLDENEFLSPFGIRSLSRAHQEHPYSFRVNGQEYRVDYEPGESATGLFGGNSNWRGPIWFPLNYLIIEALERYHYFYGDSLQVECPTGSGRQLTLQQVADELSARLVRLFLPDAAGQRPCFGPDPRYAADPHWRDLLLFHEYFHSETGRGLGASHQTGWTALIIRLLESA
ncbi:MAG TPA: glucosidase, partial [Bacillota bacterium]|nr:glucosidase [Bacillota bacterium]